MFELKIKSINRWGLTIKGSDVYFPYKKTAIRIGRLAKRINPKTRMFEEYRLWDISHVTPLLLDEKRFDRTILLNNFEY